MCTVRVFECICTAQYQVICFRDLYCRYKLSLLYHVYVTYVVCIRKVVYGNTQNIADFWADVVLFVWQIFILDLSYELNTTPKKIPLLFEIEIDQCNYWKCRMSPLFDISVLYFHFKYNFYHAMQCIARTMPPPEVCLSVRHMLVLVILTNWHMQQLHYEAVK